MNPFRYARIRRRSHSSATSPIALAAAALSVDEYTPPSVHCFKARSPCTDGGIIFAQASVPKRLPRRHAHSSIPITRGGGHEGSGNACTRRIKVRMLIVYPKRFASGAPARSPMVTPICWRA